MTEERVAKDTGNRHIRKIKHRWMNFRYNLDIFIYALWWRALWKTGLGMPYSKFMCRNGFYRKYPDGRCQYCGVKHK